MIKGEYFHPKRKSVKLEQYIFSEISLSIHVSQFYTVEFIHTYFDYPIRIIALHIIVAQVVQALVWCDRWE